MLSRTHKLLFVWCDSAFPHDLTSNDKETKRMKISITNLIKNMNFYAWMTYHIALTRHLHSYNTQKLQFFIKGFSSKCDQIRRKLRFWSHLLKKSFIENFIFCVVFWGKQYSYEWTLLIDKTNNCHFKQKISQKLLRSQISMQSQFLTFPIAIATIKIPSDHQSHWKE